MVVKHIHGLQKGIPHQSGVDAHSALLHKGCFNEDVLFPLIVLQTAALQRSLCLPRVYVLI